jgi:hypothetical protein
VKYLKIQPESTRYLKKTIRAIPLDKKYQESQLGFGNIKSALDRPIQQLTVDL